MELSLHDGKGREDLTELGQESPCLLSLLLPHLFQSESILDEHTRIGGFSELGRANWWGCPPA
jgi:hypothetical protein